MATGSKDYAKGDYDARIEACTTTRQPTARTCWRIVSRMHEPDRRRGGHLAGELGQRLRGIQRVDRPDTLRAVDRGNFDLCGARASRCRSTRSATSPSITPRSSRHNGQNDGQRQRPGDRQGSRDGQELGRLRRGHGRHGRLPATVSWTTASRSPSTSARRSTSRIPSCRTSPATPPPRARSGTSSTGGRREASSHSVASRPGIVILAQGVRMDALSLLRAPGQRATSSGIRL